MEDKASGKLAKQLQEQIDDDDEMITPQIAPEIPEPKPANHF